MPATHMQSCSSKAGNPVLGLGIACLGEPTVWHGDSMLCDNLSGKNLKKEGIRNMRIADSLFAVQQKVTQYCKATCSNTKKAGFPGGQHPVIKNPPSDRAREAGFAP